MQQLQSKTPNYLDFFSLYRMKCLCRSTKKRENQESGELQEHDTVDGVVSLDNSHQIKKSKKRKIGEES